MIDLDQGGRRLGKLRVLRPPAELRNLVEYVSAELRDRRAGTQARSWRIVPDRSGHLIFKVSRDGTRRLRAVGARSRHVDIDMEARAATVAVRLRPGGLEAWLGLPASELTDRSVDLREVMPAVAEEWLDRLTSRPAAQAAATLLAGLRQVEPRRRLDWRAEAFRGLTDASGGRIAVVDACARIGVAPRTLHKIATAELGLAPKRALRIARLLTATRTGLRTGCTWRDVAHASGYADQAHLARESRALLGEPPARFAARRGT